jgi:hypothetical protein
MGGNVLHNLAHALFILGKISYTSKPMVILHYSMTASFWLWPTVQQFVVPVQREKKMSFKPSEMAIQTHFY